MKSKPFLPGIIVSLFLIFAIYACSKSGSTTAPPPGGGNVIAVSIHGMAFPSTTTVTKGASVKWTNNDGFERTVTSDDGTSFNANVAAVASFPYVANTAGSFPYHCNIHSNMYGTLVVNP